jgi:hypothetical protein
MMLKLGVFVITRLDHRVGPAASSASSLATSS